MIDQALTLLNLGCFSRYFFAIFFPIKTACTCNETCLIIRKWDLVDLVEWNVCWQNTFFEQMLCYMSLNNSFSLTRPSTCWGLFITWSSQNSVDVVRCSHGPIKHTLTSEVEGQRKVIPLFLPLFLTNYRKKWRKLWRYKNIYARFSTDEG